MCHPQNANHNRSRPQILWYLSGFWGQNKVRNFLWIICQQTIHMKYLTLFDFLKDQRNWNCGLPQNLGGIVRVKPVGLLRYRHWIESSKCGCMLISHAVIIILYRQWWTVAQIRLSLYAGWSALPECLYDFLWQGSVTTKLIKFEIAQTHTG